MVPDATHALLCSMLVTRTVLYVLISSGAESIDDEDDVLLALAEELGNFIEYVGGPAHATSLLTPLETLAAVDEADVREKARALATCAPERARDGHVMVRLRVCHPSMSYRGSRGRRRLSRSSRCAPS